METIKVKADTEFIIKQVRYLTPDAYILRFDKNNLSFKPGQHISLGLINGVEAREYSVYSAANANFLEVLIKEVDNGKVSKKLKKLEPGEVMKVSGPHGFFMANLKSDTNAKLLFIASGTGIAPFHSFVTSNPSSDYKIIHGIRNNSEAYEREHYATERYIACTSQDENGDFYGRVTDYLLNNEFHSETQFYLCGNSNMILDSMDILHAKGFKHEQMFTEVYF